MSISTSKVAFVAQRYLALFVNGLKLIAIL